MRLKIGITGQNGFVGNHLYNTLGLFPDKFENVPFKKEYFLDDKELDIFVASCDVIVHLAAMNRHPDPKVIYDINLDLVSKLIGALDRTNSKAHILFSSSSQEDKDNLYGQSKKEGRVLFQDWAERSGGKFTGMIIPNVFGPFGKPNYNSVIATFCDKLVHEQVPEIQVDGSLKLIYITELVYSIIQRIEEGTSLYNYYVLHSAEINVSDILNLLEKYNKEYKNNGMIPELNSRFEFCLFNTFRSFINPGTFFPINHALHIDQRGVFAEVIRSNTSGQFSYSITHPGITRGNHFHMRKIERFSVIKGKALIQLRRIGTSEVLNFYLDGNEPAYVDMPIWYTHNIKNIGEEDLYTLFWINEFYDPNDPDTYFENV